MFIILGKLFGWFSRHPWIAKRIPGWFVRWSVALVPDELRGDAQLKAVIVNGMSRKLGEALDKFLDQYGETDLDDLVERLQGVEGYPIISAMGLTDMEFRQLVENELFLARHRQKQKQRSEAGG